MVVAICEQFGPGILPSQALAEDVSVLRMMRVAAMGKTEKPKR